MVDTTTHDVMVTQTEKAQELLDFFQGARAQIEADLNAAAYRVGDTQRSVYVDQVNGDNANSGLADAPVQTLQAAINMSTYEGVLNIKLMSDYHHETVSYFRNGQVNISSNVTGVKRRLTFGPTVTTSETDVSMPRFSAPTGNTFFLLKDVILVAATTAGTSTIGKSMFATTGLTSVALFNCSIELPAGSDQALMRPINGHGMGLIIQSTTFPVEMAGRWIEGVVAGTDPLTLRYLAHTNLATL